MKVTYDFYGERSLRKKITADRLGLCHRIVTGRTTQQDVERSADFIQLEKKITAELNIKTRRCPTGKKLSEKDLKTPERENVETLQVLTLCVDVFGLDRNDKGAVLNLKSKRYSRAAI